MDVEVIKMRVFDTGDRSLLPVSHHYSALVSFDHYHNQYPIINVFISTIHYATTHTKRATCSGKLREVTGFLCCTEL